MLHGQKCNSQIGNILHCMELLIGLYIHQYIFGEYFLPLLSVHFQGITEGYLYSILTS